MLIEEGRRIYCYLENEFDHSSSWTRERYNVGILADEILSAPVKECVVWWCEVYNGGEDDLSHLATSNRESLQHFTYFPKDTKGGGMIRPMYFRGDRDGSVEFPVLETLTFRLPRAGYMPPSWWGWKTPNLKKLNCILDQAKDRSVKEFFARNSKRAPRRPVGSIDYTPPLKLIQESSPSLKEVNFCFADYKDSEERKLHVAWTLLAPLDWKSVRLLFIARKKETDQTCPFAMLPDDLIKEIVQRLVSWTLLVPALEDETQMQFLKSEFGFQLSCVPK